MGYAPDYYDYEYEAEKPSEILEIEQKFNNCQEFFAALYTELTSHEPLDLATIYSYMSEISGYLDIDERQFGDLTISRESKIIQFAGV
jgi:hypothetical protein